MNFGGCGGFTAQGAGGYAREARRYDYTTARSALSNFTGTKLTVSADMSSRSKATSTKSRALRRRPVDFVLCGRNDGYEVSLERRKLYVTIPDPQAAADGLIRVIDESGDDYLFPSEWFVAVQLPVTVRRALA